MVDESHLDRKYFIDSESYNCPFCNRRHVTYSNHGHYTFDWSNEKRVQVWFISCNSCGKMSMHLTYEDLRRNGSSNVAFRNDVDLDSKIFYSVPTSFFVVDPRIPRMIRELISESEGCLKMNYLTGASACCRKAIYELTVEEKAEGDDYEERIKYLKEKYPNIDGELFDVLCHIKDMTSEKIHEQSWDKWESEHLKLFLETLKAILYEVYVDPDEKKKRIGTIQTLLGRVRTGKKDEAKRKEEESI
jgi:hypothetical protein